MNQDPMDFIETKFKIKKKYLFMNKDEITLKNNGGMEDLKEKDLLDIKNLETNGTNVWKDFLEIENKFKLGYDLLGGNRKDLVGKEDKVNQHQSRNNA